MANDLSATAVVDIKRNIAWNDLSPPIASTSTLAPEESTEFTSNRKLDRQAIDDAALGKVRVNEGDAWYQLFPWSRLGRKADFTFRSTFMYNHRTEATRFDCIDLDPYGSAVPFLDAAIGAVADGGMNYLDSEMISLLTCCNSSRSAMYHLYGLGSSCWSQLSGKSVCLCRLECMCLLANVMITVQFLGLWRCLCQCRVLSRSCKHFTSIAKPGMSLTNLCQALRLVLHSIAATAARYGRHIEPLLSLSIDFYVRLFIRVHTGPKEVKGLAA